MLGAAVAPHLLGQLWDDAVVRHFSNDGVPREVEGLTPKVVERLMKVAESEEIPPKILDAMKKIDSALLEISTLLKAQKKKED